MKDVAFISVAEDKTILEPELKSSVSVYEVIGSSRLTLVFLIRNSRDIRIEVNLNDSGSSAVIVGVAVGDGSDVISLHTVQHHKARETTSDLLVKSITRGKSSFSFHGEIQVDPKAQKTDAYQRNENLVLSSDARVNSQPALEIQADDVRCTHGATIASLSYEDILYLQSRGIPPEIAEELIVDGFLRSAFKRVEDEVKRTKAEAVLFS